MFEQFYKRISIPKKDIQALMSKVAADYHIGKYLSHKIIPVGYEDFNAILETDLGKYFIKVFASFRSLENIQRYIAIIEHVLRAGVKHPQLLESTNTHFRTICVNSKQVSICLMGYIDGKTFYEWKSKPTKEERKLLIKQAALINKIDFHPSYIPDSWSVDRFLQEYGKKRAFLKPQDQKTIDPIATEFSKLQIKKLPHALVHGDLISTNIMRNKNGKLYIIDFSVANWYPRIQELAVLFCDLMFDPENLRSFQDTYKWTIAEYQKYIKLTAEEMAALPIYTRTAHAMHIIGATWERSQGNTEGENNHWLILGRKGLELTLK